MMEFLIIGLSIYFVVRLFRAAFFEREARRGAFYMPPSTGAGGGPQTTDSGAYPKPVSQYNSHPSVNDRAVSELAPQGKTGPANNRIDELSSWFKNAYAIKTAADRQRILAHYLKKTGNNYLEAYELAFMDYQKDLNRSR